MRDVRRPVSRSTLDKRPPPKIDLSEILLENPTVVMLWYQCAEGEERSYAGHWGTAVTIAQR